MKRLALIVVLANSSCRGTITIAHNMGTAGWAQVDRPGAPSGPRYKDHFTLTTLEGKDPGCASLALAPDGPVVVLVHGIQGDGPEMEDAVPVIAASKPAGLFMFRWMPFEKLSEIGDGLALGLSRLLACRPGQQVVVVAHSAGGVVTSTAVSKVVVPADAADDALLVMTVASPLAGTMKRARHDNGEAETHFILDLGTRFVAYRPSPRGVRAVHLRSQYPADKVMKPDGDFMPNDPAVGIPNAAQIDLPAHLGHVEALAYVARQFADGSWRQYFAR